MTSTFKRKAYVIGTDSPCVNEMIVIIKTAVTVVGVQRKLIGEYLDYLIELNRLNIIQSIYYKIDVPY